MTADEITALRALRDTLRNWYNGTDSIGAVLSAALPSPATSKFISGFNSVAAGMVAGKAAFVAAIAEIDALVPDAIAPVVLAKPSIEGIPRVGIPIGYKPGVYK